MGATPRAMTHYFHASRRCIEKAVLKDSSKPETESSPPGQGTSLYPKWEGKVLVFPDLVHLLDDTASELHSPIVGEIDFVVDEGGEM